MSKAVQSVVEGRRAQQSREMVRTVEGFQVLCQCYLKGF